MGFSLSCYASHQTVAEGDNCRVIPIYQTQGYHQEKASFKGEFFPLRPARESWNANQTGWAPVGEFMAAEAGEYGRVKLQRTGQTRRQLWSLVHHMLRCSPVLDADEHGEGLFDLLALIRRQSRDLYNAYVGGEGEAVKLGEEHDDALHECWRYIWEGFLKHRLFVRDIIGRMRPMEFAIIHEDAYQTLVARQATRPRHDGLSSDIATAISEALEKAGENLGELGADPLDAKCTRLLRASRFTDLIFSVLPSYPGLPLLRDHLLDVFLKVDKGELHRGSVGQLLRLDVEGLYALAAADNLGIALAPVQFAPEEDYDNHCGRTYLQFIAEVSKKADRSRQAAMFGEFRSFELFATDDSQVKAMVAAAKGWDCGFELVSVAPIQKGWSNRLQVRMDATLTLCEVKQLLTRSNLLSLCETVTCLQN